MSALAPAVPISPPRHFSFPQPRLVTAEILKLRKQRALVITTFTLTVGVTAVVYAILALLHSTNAAKHGPAGGVTNLSTSMLVLTMLAGVCATLVGTAAGAGDLSAGVFKELVVTGRSRRALFAARIPGGLAFLLPIVALAYTVAAIASVVFAGSLAAPSAGLLAASGGWVLLASAFWFALALGVSSLVGSRSTTIGVLIALQLAIGPTLAAITMLGDGRDAIPGTALGSLAPHAVRAHAVEGVTPPMSVAAAVLALTLTVAIALGLGARRTATRDA
jgi:ABC-type transport system involved in multi-copper enzyme maturation permease subunit